MCTVDSVNFDNRSLWLNAELSLVFRDPVGAPKMASLIGTDKAQTQPCVDWDIDRCCVRR